MPYDILQQSILTTVTIPGEEAYHNHATASNKSEQQHYRYSRKRRGEKGKSGLLRSTDLWRIRKNRAYCPAFQTD